MAIHSRSSSTWIFSLKVLLTSTAIFSIAVLLKFFVPVMLEFLVSQLPLLWSSILSWLTPPYLYVVINGIIITIAASSRFQHKSDEDQPESVVAPLKVVPLPVDSRLDFPPPPPRSGGYDSVVMKSPVKVRSDFGGGRGYDASEVRNRSEVQSEVYREEEKKVENVKSVEEREDDGFVISRSSWTPSRRDSNAIHDEFSLSPEKPLVSVRFGHRKIAKPSPEAGKALGVAKPKRHDTLESTWKTITDGRPIPLARHLKKSDTWEAHGRHSCYTAGGQENTPPQAKMMKKSETFKDRNSPMSPASSGKLKKEASLSQDELNRRVEAFIKKFNEDMRLQRQESLNQYKEMVYRR